MKNAVIISKLSIIEFYLQQLDQYFPVSLEEFKNDWGLQKIAERSLLVMTEVLIDISERINAKKKIIPPKTSVESIEKLEEIGVIASSGKYSDLIMLRNKIIHHYEEITPEIILPVIENDLGMFSKFIEEIKAYEKF